MIAGIDGEKMSLYLSVEIRKKTKLMAESGASLEKIKDYIDAYFDGYEAVLKYLAQPPVIH